MSLNYEQLNKIPTDKFIVLEGLEGAGKSSAIKTIKDWFKKNRPQEMVTFTREPGGTFLAEKIRKLLITDFKEESLISESELLLMYASRMQHVYHLIIPELRKGNWVVSDRFFWSSFAYQGGGREISFERLKTIHHNLLNDFKAGLSIFLDIPPEIGLKRIQSRENDRIEKEKLSFFVRAREIFTTLSNNDQNSVLIDASQSFKKVQNDIISVLNKKLM